LFQTASYSAGKQPHHFLRIHSGYALPKNITTKLSGGDGRPLERRVRRRKLNVERRLTLRITGRKKQSDEGAALFAD
jgi:hypothetical protein